MQLSTCLMSRMWTGVSSRSMAIVLVTSQLGPAGNTAYQSKYRCRFDETNVCLNCDREREELTEKNIGKYIDWCKMMEAQLRVAMALPDAQNP